MKKALIIGCNGQDGRLLAEYLTEKKYSVYGIDREVFLSENFFKNIRIDILNPEKVADVINEIQPDEIYYFAAYHHSSQENVIDDSFLISESYKVNVFGLVNFLEGIKKISGNSRLFYAASSLIYGENENELVDETSKFNPDNIYGITKFDGMQLCRYYRHTYGLFASVGIMFNHESQYRQEKFLSKKIVKAAVRIKNGSSEKLILGDLAAETDWGFAPDYVRASQLILNLEKADDFIIASGLKHSVQFFAEKAFSYLGLDWKDHVEENKSSLFRKRKPIVGNPSKLKSFLNWEPSVSFEKMVEILIDFELQNK